MHRSCISSHQATHLISHRISSQIALPISLRVIFHVATSSRCSIAIALISIILLQCTHTHTHTHIETHPFNAVGNTSPPFVALTFDLFSIFHTFHHTINVYMDMSNTPAATHTHSLPYPARHQHAAERTSTSSSIRYPLLDHNEK